MDEVRAHTTCLSSSPGFEKQFSDDHKHTVTRSQSTYNMFVLLTRFLKTVLR